MIHVFRHNTSESARELVWALRDEDLPCQRLKQLPHPIQRRNPVPGDSVVCWGEAAPTLPATIRILNGTPLRSKYDDAVALRREGVPTIEVARTRPQTAPRHDPRTDQAHLTAVNRALENLRGAGSRLAEILRPTPNLTQVDALWTAFGSAREAHSRAIAAVPPPAAPVADLTWIGRVNNHIGGLDLLTPPPHPDYFVKKLPIRREFRVHSFLGRSIRAGMKVRRDDFAGTPHEWVRSYDAGWRISYSNNPNPITNAIRNLAHSAVRALGLDFGAVDIAELEGGQLIVLEVNRAPGIEAGTPPKYARAILEWARN